MKENIDIKTSPGKTEVRQLKLQPFYRRTKTRKGKIVPQLQLCGNWLENAGFYPDNYVSIIVREGLLIVQLNNY